MAEQEFDIAGEEVKSFPKTKKPIVFMFEPTHYVVVEGKQLKEWESLLRERVGLPAELKVADPIVQGIGTKSICTANGFDDCDYMPL
jgi:hypothetical protein